MNLMNKTLYDVVVVGGGAIGAATSYYLAKSGQSVLLIDRFNPPHPHGSSHGQSRLLRVAYAEGDKYVAMVRRAVKLWKDLEQESGETLFEQTGVLYAGSKKSAFMESVVNSAQSQEIPLLVIDQKQAPIAGLYAMPNDWLTLFEPEGGFLHTERCVAEMLRLAMARGAERLTNTQVLDIQSSGTGIAIETSNGPVTAKSVVICAGPWVGDLVPALKSKVSYQRKVMHWYADDKEQFGNGGHFKPFVVHDEDSNSWFYGVPDIDGSGVKIGDHNYENAVQHPDQIDRTISPQDTDKVDGLVKSFLPGMGKRIKSETCLYTSTANTDFILDRLPDFDRAFVASGFSGHGFKFAPTIGEIMSNMVLGHQSDFDLTSFALAAHS